MEELKIEIIKEKHTNLQIAHSLVEAKLKSTTLQQQKIMLMIADRIQTKEVIADHIDLDRIYKIRFKQTDFIKELGVQKFKDVEVALRELKKQEISYKRTDEDGEWRGYTSFFYDTEFLEDKEVLLTIGGKVLVFLSLLHRGGYTKIIKEIAMSLDSKYSLRMYELCSKIAQQHTKKREYELKEFYELIGFPTKQKNLLAKVREMLEETKEELELKTNIKFEYEFETKKYNGKGGRPAYTHITFEIY